MESDTTTLLLLFSLSFTRFCSKYIVTTTLNDRGLQDCRSSIVQYKMHAMLTAENRSLPGQKKQNLCGCWDSSPGLHGHNVEFSPLNYSHLVQASRV